MVLFGSITTKQFAPASDIDIFIYGLNEPQAIQKMEHIKACIRGNVLGEATAVRTRNAITIISRFDVDCAGVAFNGSQVWATPRALAAFMTQVNTVDFTRCSPLYENRLAKYAKRGFEVLWQGFDRSKIDRTIFDRDASQVVGLARLLVLEKGWIERNGRSGSGVDSSSHRDRRAGVCDGEDSSETSNYEFICIPYGPGYDATRITKRLQRIERRLNRARPGMSSTKLHRHPCFVGSVKDVVLDCCSSCPDPETETDMAMEAENSRRYVSGAVRFLKVQHWSPIIITRIRGLW
ncbi:hypothetical protein VTN96DRAFT_9043 [Rasamsonia emersonii]